MKKINLKKVLYPSAIYMPPKVEPAAPKRLKVINATPAMHRTAMASFFFTSRSSNSTMTCKSSHQDFRHYRAEIGKREIHLITSKMVFAT